MLPRLEPVTRRQRWGLSSFWLVWASVHCWELAAVHEGALGMLPCSAIHTPSANSSAETSLCWAGPEPNKGKSRLQLWRGLWPPRESSQPYPLHQGPRAKAALWTECPGRTGEGRNNSGTKRMMLGEGIRVEGGRRNSQERQGVGRVWGVGGRPGERDQEGSRATVRSPSGLHIGSALSSNLPFCLPPGPTLAIKQSQETSVPGSGHQVALSE